MGPGPRKRTPMSTQIPDGPPPQVIILAGGKGERLRPYTDDRPKPMVPILDKPILEYQVRWFASQGVRRIAISCGYLADVIQDYFGDGRKFGVEIRYAIEADPLGRGGGIKLAWNELEDTGGPVIATNGDIVTAFPLAPMLEAHAQTGAKATVLVVPFKSVVGIVDIEDDGRVSGFRSEPVLPYWVNGGVYVFDPVVRAMLPDKGDHEESTFPDLARTGHLRVYKTAAFWRAVDTVKDMSVVRDYLTGRLIDSFLGS
jgi:NDP-sugar pyrophosphorylase family protein